MRKKDAKIIRNLRMGIPAMVSSGLPQTSRIAEKQAAVALPEDNRRAIEAAAVKVSQETKENYDQTDRPVEQNPLPVGQTAEISRPETKPQSLFAAYAQAEAEQEFQKNKAPQTDSQKDIFKSQTAGKDKVLRKFVFDNEFLEKYLINHILSNRHLFEYYVLEQGKDINAVVAEMKDPLRKKLLETFVPEKRRPEKLKEETVAEKQKDSANKKTNKPESQKTLALKILAKRGKLPDSRIPPQKVQNRSRNAAEKDISISR